MLLGFDDGKPLQEPADGVEIVTNRRKDKKTGKAPKRVFINNLLGGAWVDNFSRLPPEGPPTKYESEHLRGMASKSTLTINSMVYQPSRKNERGEQVWEWKTK